MQTIYTDKIKYNQDLFQIGTTDKGLCYLAPYKNNDLKTRFPSATFIEKKLPNPFTDSMPFDLHGTDFQIKVWNALQTIPKGQTTTYSAIAKQIGQPTATRAVGSAIGKNPIALLIPCHRVLRSDGHIGGYAWGIEMKKQLLTQEAA